MVAILFTCLVNNKNNAFLHYSGMDLNIFRAGANQAPNF